MSGDAKPPDAKAARGIDALEATFQVAQLSVRRALSGWRPFVSLAVVALPALLGGIVRLAGASTEAHERFLYGMVSGYHFGIAVPFVALVFATAFPWPEAEEGTLTYWFTTPIPRWTVLLGRYLAALFVGSITLSLGIVAIGLPLAPPAAAEMTTVLLASLTATLLVFPAYLALFQFVATWLRHGLVFGVIFILVENSIALLSGTIVRLTLIYYVRSEVWPAVPRDSQRLAAPYLKLDEPASATAALIAFGSVTLVGVLASLLAVSVIEYRGRSTNSG